MKKIELTQGKWALVDDNDFESLNKYKWCATKYKTSDSWYAIRSIYSKKSDGGDGSHGNVRMHHQIIGKKRNYIVDHADGNGLNNQRKNLRFATKSTNGMNRKVQKNTKSQLKGVYIFTSYNRKKKYYSRIYTGEKDVFLGYFFTPQEAHEAYIEAAKKYHKEFAKW